MASAVPKMLSPRDVAEVLGVSYETALAFIRYSGIDYLKVGRQYRVSEEKIAAFLSKKGQVVIDLNESI